MIREYNVCKKLIVKKEHMMEKTIIEVKDLCKEYGSHENKVEALSNISFGIKKGEFVAVVGTSGSGKSTLLNLLGGLDVPTSGKIKIADKDMTALKNDKLTRFRSKHIGFVFQNYSLIPVLNVYDNVVLGATINGKCKIDHEKAKSLMESLQIWNKRKNYPNELSGGQQQRVAIARALFVEPDIILADEPTGNLDQKNTLEVMNLLGECSKKYNQTIIMVTHENDMAAKCDRQIRISDGKLEEVTANV